MTEGWSVIALALGYVSGLFALAWYADKTFRARQGGQGRPLIYALSLAALSGAALVATTVIVWASLTYLFHKPVSWFPLVSWWSSILPREFKSWPGVPLTLSVFGLGVIVVAVFSIIRYVGEMLTINPIKRDVAGP